LVIIAGRRSRVVKALAREQVANVSMGTELDNVTELEDLAERREDAPIAVIAMPD
jgi:tartronate-semialdehyde synthase